jgi:LuxR family maltose regulon positive regulatory protein
VRGAPRPAEAAAAIHGDDRHIVDYLSSEVIDRMVPEQRDLLVRTSVLERLCGPLCDHVLDRVGSDQVLADLDRDHLFVVPLDDRRDWYRCHRLFREVMRGRLEASDSDEVARVHRMAAEWFLDRGHLEEAVGHLISGDDEESAAAHLRASVPSFLERGALAAHLRLGQRLSAPLVMADPQLCVSLAWAAGLSGQFTRMGPWLDAAEPLIDEHSPPLEGWCSLRGAAHTMRAVHQGVVAADAETAVARAAAAVELEPDPRLAGYVVARTILGAMLTFSGRAREAVPILTDAWDRAQSLGLPPLLAVQPASLLSMALIDTDHTDPLRRLLAEVAPVCQSAETMWGTATSPGIARLRTVEGQLSHRDGRLDEARSLLQRAVELARTFGEGPGLVSALTSLAEVELDDHDRGAARAALSQAREVVDNEPVLPRYVERLEELEKRAGRTASRQAQTAGVLAETLTDREWAVLRALSGDATQREIGAELYLSVNTIKGYTRGLYRKLGVVCRQDAVRRARALDLL